jgi:cation transport protein ChaC
MTCHVFAYASLMWNPGFDHITMHHGTLHGYHRQLCIWSWHWRGSREKPGLVMGLAPGRHCRGRVIEADRGCEDAILAYLDERELVTDVYERKLLPTSLEDGRTVEAWCYVARTDHPQFAGDLPVDQMLPVVLAGHGHGGANTDYVRSTVEHLIELGIHEPVLEELLAGMNGALRQPD